MTGRKITNVAKEVISDGKSQVKPLTKVIQGEAKLNAPILIAGFPGAGMVGSISTSYIIEKLGMHQIACVESDYIVPGVIYVGGKLRHPFRLYANEEGTVCVLVCESPIMIQGIHSVLDTVMKWVLNAKSTEVIVLDGIAIQGIFEGKREPMILSSDGQVADKANLLHDEEYSNDNKKSHFNTAFIGGTAGGLLSSCLSNGLACKAVLIAATSGIPDPEGAAILIESVAKIADNQSLKIDTQELREQGADLRRRMEQIMRSVQEQQYRQRGQDQQQGQSNVGEGAIMYG
ncbi:MAG: PAC2 family protein [Thermoproteota archaeon]|jgi:uncharacterized protein|nr:PAC2 family protein [Thermoproteota archaeon]